MLARTEATQPGRAPLLAPIQATLRAMAQHPLLPPLTGLAPRLTVPTNEPGWISAVELVNGEALPDLIDTAVVHWLAARHVAASLAWRQYAYWLALPALVGFAAARRVPLLHPRSVLVRWSPTAPFLAVGLTRVSVAVAASDPLADAATGRVRVVPNDDRLLEALRSSLVEEHLEPIMARLHDAVQLGHRSMRGSIASGVAHALRRAGRVVPDTGPEFVTRVLGALDLARLVEVSATGVRRRTCCLGFKLAKPKICSDCLLR